ncbi:MAG: S1C family serine protease [Pirellulales bacterium]
MNGLSRTRPPWLATAVVLLLSAAIPAAAATTGETIAGAARSVVKIYGAGGVRGLEAYQTGVLVTPTGHVITVLSTVLDSDAIDCVLDDGRRFAGRLIGADPRRELAVLALEGEELPALPLTADLPRLGAGSRVLALSNLFGVAVGDERVSAQHGVVAAVVPLDARRGAYEAPYRGDVYILDCTTNNPGSPGGALIDWRGRLVGLLGKELRASASGVWLNYALPIDEVAKAYDDIIAGRATAPATTATERFDPAVLGVILVPDLLDKTPPFIETVRAGSPAAAAGLRPDDLLVAVNGRAVPSRMAVQQTLGGLAAGDPVHVTVVRDGMIVDCDLGPRPAREGGR